MPSRAIVVIPCVHQLCVLGATISEGSKISMYANDILLSKPINHPDNYDDLQRDIDAIQECISKCHLTLNPSKCKYLIVSRKREPHLPRTRLFIGRDVLEQVDSYRYLGVLVTSKLSWADHNHICIAAKPGNLLECCTGSFTPGLTQAHCFTSTLPAYVNT